MLRPFRSKKKTPDQGRLNEIINEISRFTDSNRSDELFIELFSWIRPTSKDLDQSVKKVGLLLNELRTNAAFEAGCVRIFEHLLEHKDFTSLFTDTGILISGSFFGEISRAFRQKVLPPLPDKNSMQYLLARTFYKKNDYKFVNHIPKNLWLDLFKQIGSKINANPQPVRDQIFNALSMLSYRVMSLAVSDDLSKRWKADTERYQILLEQNRTCAWLIQLYKEGRSTPETISETLHLLNQQLTVAQNLVNDIRSNSVIYGTSLAQSYTTSKINQQIIRMKALLKMLDPEGATDSSIHTSVLMFTKMVEQINKSDQVLNVISQSVGLLAYQVTEHKRETGEHYITTDRKGYFDLLGSALKGGLIICVAALIKAQLHYVDLPQFWSYFLYGLNYSLAFIIMYLTHATLATKQPAMTAAALAGALDAKNKEGGSATQVSITLARVWRSQFVSFLGNMLAVFPVCIFIAYTYEFISTFHLLRPQGYAHEILMDQHPGHSLAWIYAGVTGIFLFLSGIISGYVDNKVVYSNIPARILEHPTLRRLLKPGQIAHISNFFKNHIGSVTGNTFLGMALGFAPLIGKMFGVPFDIRHITISLAFYGFGIVGMDFSLPVSEWIWISIGIIGIGFINFLVSFGLAFITALKSRNIPLRDIREYISMVFRHLRKYPFDFIFPPKQPRRPEEL